MDLKGLKYLIVGSGFFGSTLAQLIASDRNEKVLVIEKRAHIGGNCFSLTDKETQIEYHKYGAHIFHTSNKEIWDYIGKFTDFSGYRHQVLVTHKNKVYQMPINLETINSFYGLTLKPYEVDRFLKAEIAKETIKEPPKNFEEKAILQIGRPLYEAFIKGYTIKQWGKDPKDLPVSILNRLPFRKNYDESYFFDTWQGVPSKGYTSIFKKMLDNKNIELKLNTDYFKIRNIVPKSCKVIYSGPIDRFLDFKYGKLEWIGLRFENEVLNLEDFQGTAVMNYSDLDVPFTRIQEPKHLHQEKPQYRKNKTLLIREYPQKDNFEEPFYPINDQRNLSLLNKYLKDALKLKDIYIGGRLGDYHYYDIDKTIEQAFKTYKQLSKRKSG